MFTSKVPPLENLEDLNVQEEDSDGDVVFSIKLQVLRTIETPELYRKSDLERLHKNTGDICEALNELSNRSDIIYYITGSDLLKINSDPTKKYVRLIIEKPKTKNGTSNGHYVKTSPTTKSRSLSNSPKPSELITSPTSIDRSQSATHTDRPQVDRHGNERKNSKKSSDRPQTIVLTDRIQPEPRSQSDRSFVNVNLLGTPFMLYYTSMSEKFCIFRIDREADRLVCRGLTDGQLMSSTLITYKSINSLKIEQLKFTLYAIGNYLESLSFPIYIMINTINYECTEDEFVKYVEPLINFLK